MISLKIVVFRQNRIFVVAFYEPTGNVVRQFAENVEPPKDANRGLIPNPAQNSNPPQDQNSNPPQDPSPPQNLNPSPDPNPIQNSNFPQDSSLQQNLNPPQDPNSPQNLNCSSDPNAATDPNAPPDSNAPPEPYNPPPSAPNLPAPSPLLPFSPAPAHPLLPPAEQRKIRRLKKKNKMARKRKLKNQISRGLVPGKKILIRRKREISNESGVNILDGLPSESDWLKDIPLKPGKKSCESQTKEMKLESRLNQFAVNGGTKLRSDPEIAAIARSSQTPGNYENRVSSGEQMKVQQEVLDAHNYYRAWHEAPPLVIDNELMKYAQQWADVCIFSP